MEMWKLRKWHEEDIQNILREAGCIFDKGFMRRFNGGKVTELMEKTEHTSLTFENCNCKLTTA